MARAKYQFLPDLSEDDIRLLDRVSDWIMAADEKYITKFSAFLDERQCLLCEKLMASVSYFILFAIQQCYCGDRKILTFCFAKRIK